VHGQLLLKQINWFAAPGSLVFIVKMDYDDSSVLPSLESSAIFPSKRRLYQSLHCLSVMFCLRKYSDRSLLTAADLINARQHPKKTAALQTHLKSGSSEVLGRQL